MRYLVSGWASISVNKEIEAESEEEAREKFMELCPPGLCWQCSTAGSGIEECFELNGWDDNLNITEVETRVADDSRSGSEE